MSTKTLSATGSPDDDYDIKHRPWDAAETRRIAASAKRKLEELKKRDEAFRLKASAMGLDVTRTTWCTAYFELTGPRRVSDQYRRMVIHAQCAGWHPTTGNDLATVEWRPSLPSTSSGTTPRRGRG